MTKAELIEKIARSRDLPADMTKKCIAEIVDVAFKELATYFARTKVTRSHNPRFTFPGFGTFTKKKRSARRGVNPRTLEPIEIDACVTLDFRPGTELRAAMNPGRASKTKSKDGDGGSGKAQGARKKAKPAAKTKKRSAAGSRSNSHQAGTKRRKAGARAAATPKSPRGRKLTPRDDDGGLDVTGDGGSLCEELSAELPRASLQRVRSNEGDNTRRRAG